MQTASVEEGSVGGLRNRRSLLLGFAVLELGAKPIFAQTVNTPGFAIDRFDPSDRGSDWFVLESVNWSGKLQPAVGLVVDFANKPLVLYDPEGEERTVIVESQLFTHLGASLVVADRLRFGVSLPIALSQSGDTGMVGDNTFPPSGSASIGDVRLSAGVKAYGTPGGPFSIAIGLAFFLPTGDRDQYSGDEEIRILPQVLIGGRAGAMEYALKGGFHYRGLNDASINGAPLGSEICAAAAIGVRAANDRLLIGPEIYGSTIVSSDVKTDEGAFDRRTSPLEALLGVHYSLNGGLRLAAGVGVGLTRGLGSPALRVVTGIEWLKPEAVPSSNRDGDNIIDREDACPDERGPSDPDPSKHGCPIRDRDGDGVLDLEDACADVPGVRTDAPNSNGCPPSSDRDGDGAFDEEDACPDLPGVRTDNPKTNGCPPPPPDRDGDSVIDLDDACPDVPGPATTDPNINGCPRARIERQQIIIREQIKFEFHSDVILDESETVLLGVREILASHPEITQVRIEGHTDNVGSDTYNKRLSQRRAQAVVKWLVKVGVDKKRLYGKGFGEDRPIDTNDTDAGRQNNRRVEFHIESQAEDTP